MRLATFAMTCTAAAIIGASAVAQTQQQQQQQRPGDRQMDRETDRQAQQPMRQQIRPPDRDAEMFHHVDDIHNKNVTNMQGENLGSIETLIVDMQDGYVTFAVVSVGGFLGIADTLVVVPWQSFQLRPMYDGLVLNMTRSQLEAAPSFDRGQWPNFGDQRWSQEVHQYYGTTPRAGMQQRPGQQQQPGAQEQPGQPQQPGAQQQDRLRTAAQYVRTTDIIGARVDNPQGEQIADINDVAMEIREGHIEFAVLGVGGFLGLWQSNVAVPWQALEYRPADDDHRFMLNATRDQLERAPEYDHDGWPERRAVEWSQGMFPEADRRPGTQRQPGAGERQPGAPAGTR